MKALKIIGIVLVSILLILVVVGYLQPEKMTVETSIVVEAPVAVAFDQVNDLKKRTKWSPWEQMDTTMTFEFNEQTKGEGASYSWKSETQGSGQLSYTKVVPNKEIITDLNFGEQGTATGTFKFEEVQEGTKVIWGFETEPSSNPFNRLAMAIFAPGLKVMFDQGLNAMKAAAEAETGTYANAGITITLEQVEPYQIISVMDSAGIDEMAAHYEKSYGQLFAFAEQNGLEVVGPPLSITHTWYPETKSSVFEPALPVSGEAAGNDDVMVKMTYEGKAVKAIHLGNYNEVEPTYEAAMAYLQEKALEENGMPWEVYVTDPGQQPDTAQWITEIYIPVK